MSIAKAGPRSSGADANTSSPATPLKRTAVSDTCGWWLTGLIDQERNLMIQRKAVPMAQMTLDAVFGEKVISHTFDPDAALAWVRTGEL